nr:methionine-R-sulfoxide reductase [Helicobacter mustelae]
MMNKLTEQEAYVILQKGTEPPFSGEYDQHFEEGVYVCRQCENPLFTSEAKFKSGCGWPSFDDCILDGVRESLDNDGRRIEITCARCGGHLGHVFRGEGFTQKDTRHCVNSLSIRFKKSDAKSL